jgi:hypothetical protein
MLDRREDWHTGKKSSVEARKGSGTPAWLGVPLHFVGWHRVCLSLAVKTSHCFGESQKMYEVRNKVVQKTGIDSRVNVNWGVAVSQVTSKFTQAGSVLPRRG